MAISTSSTLVSPATSNQGRREIPCLLVLQAMPPRSNMGGCKRLRKPTSTAWEPCFTSSSQETIPHRHLFALQVCNGRITLLVIGSSHCSCRWWSWKQSKDQAV